MENNEEITKFILNRLRETPTFTKEKTTREGIDLPTRNAYLTLENHVNEFLEGNPTNRLIVFPGLRGTGKTTILLQIYNYLTTKKNLKQENVFYFSAEDVQTFLDKNIADIIKTYIENIHQTSLIGLQEKIFLLIDEAHFDENWSKTAKVVYDNSKNIFTIVTGSSALLLEEGADAARRIKKEQLFPLNFQEYLLLKHNFYPPSGTAETIRTAIFQGDKNSVDSLASIEAGLNKRMLALPKSPEQELREYIYYGGFPFGIFENRWMIYEKLSTIFDKIISKDLSIIHSFRGPTQQNISRILIFLALQKPGTTSQPKIANSLSISPSNVNRIFDSLEKTQLIFSVNPYGGAGKTIRKHYKYYFLSPTLNASLMWKVGRLDENSNEVLGILVEHAVASSFYRMSKTIKKPIKPMGMFYDPSEGGVDFLLLNNKEEIIPLEVGVGKKDTKQIKNAIRRFKSNYGVVISSHERVRLEDNVIFMPIKTFLFS